MRETDYQALYRLFHAFTACGKKATQCVSSDNDVAPCETDQDCFSTDGTELYLCAECLEFWHLCRRMQDRSTWEMAVFLRRSRVEREYEK